MKKIELFVEDDFTEFTLGVIRSLKQKKGVVRAIFITKVEEVYSLK